MKERTSVKLGCHVSIRGGYAACARTAKGLGAQAFQFFPKNPRSLGVKSYDTADANRCFTYLHEHGLAAIGHTAYPVNLAHPDPVTQELITASVLNDLEIVDACGGLGLVVHFGKMRGNGVSLLDGYKLILARLNSILEQHHGTSLILLENQAGDGTDIGMTLEELYQIRSLCARPEKVAFCLDTCHLFASGEWRGYEWKELWSKGDALGLWPLVRVVHYNDSVYPTGHRKDRHAIVGSGAIGERYMTEVLLSNWEEDTLFILETPSTAERTYEKQLEEIRANLGQSE